jgi:hypothetical protein
VTHYYLAVFTTARAIVSSLPQVQNIPSSKSSKPTVGTSKSTLQTMWAGNDTTLSVAELETNVPRSNGLREIPKNVPKQDVSSLQSRQNGASAVASPLQVMSQTGSFHPVKSPTFSAQLPHGPPAVPPTLASTEVASSDISHASSSSDTVPLGKLAGTKRRLGMSSRGADFPRKK